MPARADPPPRQYLAADDVLDTMAHKGARGIRELSVLQVLVLSAVGGGFITLGALFSVLLASGVETQGTARLLEGLGFSAGFFFVILAEAVLFTEANVVLPATLVERDVRSPAVGLARFWALAWAGNLLGAFVTGWTIHVAQSYPAEVTTLLGELVDRKMQPAGLGSILGGALLVVLPFWFALHAHERQAVSGTPKERGRS